MQVYFACFRCILVRTHSCAIDLELTHGICLHKTLVRLGHLSASAYTEWAEVTNKACCPVWQSLNSSRRTTVAVGVLLTYPAVSRHHVEYRFLRIVSQGIRHIQHGCQVLLEARSVWEAQTRNSFCDWLARTVRKSTPRSVKVPLVQAANLLPVQS